MKFLPQRYREWQADWFVTVWRTYNVGKGETLQWSKVPGENQYEIILNCTTTSYKLKIYMVLCNVKIYVRNINIQCFSV